MGVRRPARPPRSCGQAERLGPGRRRPPVPDLDDLRLDSGAPRRPDPGHAVRARSHRGRLRSRVPTARRQAVHHRRHVDDGEAGRIRRSGQHDPCRGAARRHLPDHRAQVVHVRADVGPPARARPGARRTHLLRRPARAPGRHGQRHPPAAAEGQARQPLEREQRGRVRRRGRMAARRRGPRRADDHRHGQHDAARLHDRLRHLDASRRVASRTPRRAPSGVRRPADRPAADAQRARRPRRRGRGRHHRRAVAGGADRPGRVRRRARRDAAPGEPGRQQVPRVQTVPHPCGRGPGVPGRQRLRRGLPDAAALPRGPADVGVGGLGQRRRARHAAGGRQAAGVAGGVLRRARRGPRHRPALRRVRRRAGLGVHRPRHHGVPRPPRGRRHGHRPAGLTAAAARTPGRRRRVRGQPTWPRPRRRLRHPAERARPRPDHRAVHAQGHRRDRKKSSHEPSTRRANGRRLAGERAGGRRLALRRTRAVRRRPRVPHPHLRGDRPDRAHHVQPSGPGQRHHQRHSRRPGARRRTRRPRPARPRHPAVRTRQGVLRRLRPDGVRRERVRARGRAGLRRERCSTRPCR